MKLAIIGTGYVGLVTGTIFAEMGHDIYCVDVLPEKVERLTRGEPTIYEPGLEELIKRNVAEGRLRFTTNHREAITDAVVIINAVNTPSADDGSVDLTAVKQASADIGRALADLPVEKKFFRVIVNKSTVPIGTANLVRDIVREHYNGEFDVVSNPEFLREGQAVSDCLHPDRIVIGDGHPESHRLMQELYRPFDAPMLFTDVQTAEMIKYASNAFLAMSISFINNLSWLCEAVGADVTKVAEGMKLDKRIGPNAFLSAGPGYGGSCFPKDVKGIVDIGHQYGIELSLLTAADKVNQQHREKILAHAQEMVGDWEGKRVAIWGLAFKPQTDDLRDAASTFIVPALLAAGVEVHAFDPVAQDKAKELWPAMQVHSNPYETLTDVDLLIVLTEWREFTALDRHTIHKLMRRPAVFDTRNIWNPAEMKGAGFEYRSIGRTTPEAASM